MESAQVTNGHASQGRPKTGSGKNNKKLKLVGLAVGVVVLALLLFGGWMTYRSTTAASIDKSKYQAVFLSNGQVYFGKLSTLNGSYMKLSDIFYLQASADDAEQESQNPQEGANRPTNDVQLIKLGSEVHGPEDVMVISKEEILFFENLKPDGKVSDSISKYQRSQGQ